MAGVINTGRVLIVCITVALILTVFGNKGLVDYFAFRSRVESLREVNGRMISENEKLRLKIRMLKTDLKYIEKIARKELGMVKKGDTVYMFVDSTK